MKNGKRPSRAHNIGRVYRETGRKVSDNPFSKTLTPKLYTEFMNGFQQTNFNNEQKNITTMENAELLQVENIQAEELDINGQSKVDRYGWIVKDEPGKFEMLDKSLLKVDHDYQRTKITNHRILKIAREWSWIACNALCVARRPDGSLWLMDGQHRKLAADKRSDIERLPCMVWDVEDSADEARGFLNKNTLRTSVSSHQRFKSRLYARDELALTIKRLIEDSGYKIADTDSKGTVRCIATIEQAYKRDQQLATVAWNTSVRICSGDHITKDIFGGLFQLEIVLQKEGKGSISDGHNVEKLLSVGPDIISNVVKKVKGLTGKGGTQVSASGILAVLNHGRSSRKIKLDGMPSYNISIS